MQIPLSHQVDIAGFHSEATRLLAQLVPPDDVEWSAVTAQSVDEQQLDGHPASIRNRAARAIIPQSFIRMSELVVLHRDADRFALLYRSLWRLVYEPALKNDHSDTDLARLRQMAQAVRRDIQKMKSRLTFRALDINGESTQVAWYEPAHYVSELVATWLANREPAARWVLLTPDRSMRWDGQHLLSAPAVALMQQPLSVTDDSDWSQVLGALSWL